MSLKNKIIFFTSGLLATAAILGLGAVYIFNSLGKNLDILAVEVQQHKLHQELRSSFSEFLRATKGWALTGDANYRRIYKESLSKVNKSFGELDAFSKDRVELKAMGEDFQAIKERAKTIIETDDPVADSNVLMALETIELEEAALMSKIDVVHQRSIASTMAVVAAGEKIRTNMTFYLTVLIAFSLLTSGFLVIIMRRMLETPYREMLAATEKVASGDLSFRISSDRKDEFGVISRRFDSMVESLEQSDTRIKLKLKETELFLTAARIAGMTPDLKEALGLLVKTIAEKTDKDLCAVFLLRPEKKGFCLESCNVKEVPGDLCLPLDSATSRGLLETSRVLVVEETATYPEMKAFRGVSGSLMAVPILRDQNCVGILLLGRKEAGKFAPDDIDTAVILAHTLGATVRNAELYEATKRQLKQLSIVYELSKALTSVYDPDEVLRTVSAEVAKLINARGCTIRLIEEGMLRVKSYFGTIEEPLRELSVPLGQGIAGWVAKEGRSLFVEDISKMPEEIKGPALATKSAISVPLKVGDRIIGTLGLFDKLNERGDIIAFSLDDLAAAEGFASISAIAIEKARMHEEEVISESKIMAAKKRLDLLFESVQGGIITLDRNYTITAANRYIERWIDMPLQNVIYQNAIEVFHGRGGICPHCAAKATFDTGDINSITQSSGLNYAELSSYPLKDEKGEVAEAVVFIQDITDRVLYQEEIMGLYKEVMQAKEYIESLINNSADAIVTTDLNGTVKSWNPAAEGIYGFTEEEVIGRFIPFIPESLMEMERENMEKIKKGEVLKLETFRKRKDETLIEVSLTLSPIKDVTGEIIGISGISRDISDKKRVEKELIRRNQELSRLFFISSTIRGTLELDRLLRMVLTAVTMSDGLGFNRAILFLVDENAGTLKGTVGVGPANAGEAWQIWDRLSIEKRTLREIMHEIEEGPLRKDSFLDRLSMGIEIPLAEDSVLTRAVRQKRAANVHDVKAEPMSDSVLIQQLGTEAYAAVPLVSRDKVLGVLWVDNLFNKRPITDEDMKFLLGFADQMASAVEAARLFQKVSLAEAELENIFRSISDMVFFTDRDYTVKKVNQAVEDHLRKPAEDLVGRKCYEVFHGMDAPWPLCPHHKTVETMKPHVEELEDRHLKGTFLTSTSPIFDREGNFLGTVHVVRDITDIKQLQDKLQSAERMAALGEVAAKVAHEIRNPLVSVGGFAKRLENKLEGNLREYAHIISNEVSRLEEILRDILGFVREVRMSKRVVDLNDVVKETLELISTEFAEKGNRVVKDFDGTGLMMSIDPDRIKEAVMNVIANANQATDGGAITVRTYRMDGDGVLEVADTGYGIKKEDLTRIFDPFFTTRPTGTGLGLAIAKRIIEEHDGRVGVESKWPGGGTKFTISLPLKEERDEKGNGRG
jgi:PAS domain S-box-containing protein